MSGIGLLIVFVLAIAFMIYMISKLNIHAFFSLMVISLLLALVAGISLGKIPSIIGDGFSGIFKSIGIVIIFGAFIGMILEKTGAALKLADMVVSKVGEKRPNLAMMIMGFIVGIPVFCDSGFVVLNPIRKALAQKIAGANPVGLAVALSGGLYISHVIIPPTPGPIAAAGAIGVGGNLILVILMGFVVSLPVLFATYLFSKYIDKTVFIKDDIDEVKKSYDELKSEFTRLPSGCEALMPIVLPIVFMALGSIASILGISGVFGDICKFLGSPVIALGIGVLFGVYLLFKSSMIGEFHKITEDCLKVVGPIIFITAAGGVLGKVITEAGMVDFIKQNANIVSSFGIFFPFVIAAILKTAQGSSTVAIVTTASIMGLYTSPESMMAALGLVSQMDAVLAVMAIGCGAMCISHANDSYFWVVSNFSNLTPAQGCKTQTVLTFIMGIVGVLWVFVLSLVL